MNRLAYLALSTLLALSCGPSGSSDTISTAGDDGPDAGSAGICTPGQPVCVGSDLHECDDRGMPADRIITCEFGCANGQCSVDPGGGEGNPDDDGCASDASGFVYVVDNANSLYRFNPANDAHTFTLIGRLNCPAGPPITGGIGGATPFSMSVDRNATGWVLYSSGEIFHVSTQDASCRATAFQKQQNGYDLMGMGFVSDSPNSKEEKLFVAGSTIDPISGSFQNTKLGYITPATLVVSHLTNVNGIENPPELTGTGDAKLYGYFPGASSTISELDKATGQRVPGQQWPAGNVTPQEQLVGWAFAQWGGRFYVFVTSQTGIFGGAKSKVIRVDPKANGGAGEAVTVKNSDVPYIVGAGVSTCAPIIID